MLGGLACWHASASNSGRQSDLPLRFDIALADSIETWRLGPDGTYAVEGFSGSEVPTNLHRDVIDAAASSLPGCYAGLHPLLSKLPDVLAISVN